jgi:monofunctional biosynthetic peptidoglycan transglycosylase
MIKKNTTRIIKQILFTLLLIGEGFLVSYFFFTLPDVEFLKSENIRTTALIELRKRQAARMGSTLKIRQKWVKNDAIPQLLKDLVVLSEDLAFYRHCGIDYRELIQAIKKNLKTGKILRGASTITQQLARNLFLSPEKTYYRKLKEFFIAKELERHLSKERILYIYLNVIELGHGIFGVEAASEYYYGKSVEHLTLSEIVRLVAVIPRPLKAHPVYGSHYLKTRSQYLLLRLKKFRYITEEQYNKVKVEFQ